MGLSAEREQALRLAAAILDRPWRDPDDDLAVLARQLARAQEEINGLRQELKRLDVRNLLLKRFAQVKKGTFLTPELTPLNGVTYWAIYQS